MTDCVHIHFLFGFHQVQVVPLTVVSGTLARTMTMDASKPAIGQVPTSSELVAQETQLLSHLAALSVDMCDLLVADGPHASWLLNREL